MSIELLLGTYTRRKSEGVYQVELNTEEKKLENLSLLAKVGSPTYLAKNDKENIIYSIVNEDGHGGVLSLVQNEDGNYVRQSTLVSEGPSPAYIAFDNQRNFIYTSNYHKGEVAVYSSDHSGNLKKLDTITHSGSSVHENQKSPHVHYSNLTPDGKYLAVCDLGTDEVYTYEIDDQGQLSEKARLKVKKGSGPRHLTFHPSGKIAYLFAELSSEIIVLDYHSDRGEFSERQTLSTIPESHTEFNGGAAVRLTKDGQFLYASNRGHDSIAIFKTDDQGELSLVDYQPTEGNTPRDFNLDPSERFLIVGHQDSDNLTLFERNQENGQLKLLQKDFFAPEVVNIHL
ncbi:MAG: lactonase family protein [Lactococcus lactis]|nr:lactonase family protein [Lactococcus lactis]MDN6195924.1 lactonase family protein [Atopostipes suicloacalis]